jgi:hypothetical protein
MDVKTKEQLRWKFYSLVLQLNAIILLVAFAVLAFFLVPMEFRYTTVAVLLVAVVVLSFIFRRKYVETKAWRDEQLDKKEDKIENES